MGQPNYQRPNTTAAWRKCKVRWDINICVSSQSSTGIQLKLKQLDAKQQHMPCSHPIISYCFKMSGENMDTADTKNLKMLALKFQP